MTEYGRGPGSAPWHPEDPLYGDSGWAGQQADAAQSPYGGQPQHHPQQPEQQHYGEWADGRQAAYDQSQQGYQQYPDQGHQDYQQHSGQGQQQYQQQGQQQYPQQGQQQGQQQYPQQGQQQGQQQYPQQGQQPGQQQYQQQGQQYSGQMQQQYGNGGWDGGGQGQAPYPADPADPYGAQAGAYGGEQPDFYQTPDAYPPPEPPNRRRAEPEPETDWDPGPDQGEHAFFADGDDDEDDVDEPGDRRGREERKGRGGKEKGGGKERKRRNGCACLVVVLVLGGGVGGVGYYGYEFYQNRFGAAPDYAGDGTGEQITVTIPKGSFGSDIGLLLKKAGVVKSVDAFVAAQEANPNGKSIQAGTYTLNKQMSAAAAVELMLSPKSKNNLIIAEGWRNAKIYAAIDDRLKLKAGTTQDIAKKEWKTFGLPDWANTNKDIKDPLEGFLYPSSYPVAKSMKPADVLKQMVDMAKQKYAQFGIQAKAKSLNLQNPLQLLTVASLVQAEGKTHDDYRKMAEVIYNRLKPTNTETYQLLQFDSTFNYLKGQSKIHIGLSEINRNQDPYNTYTHKGLPPGPIDNPGESALEAALKPTSEGWIYFVATDGMEKTEFAKTHAEFQKLRDKFNDSAGR
ncbi:endolytic transglycosylase MltG [Streptomyces yaanensis]|uniref:Endolytic murein transglycosylase n=1 Tax=Streptomyces yaanensis TaxID=1142239 RepID=A0ABV7S4N6_9ACTN|nr:endolytic transglycosylase MltG [Streptomyces sp. CGMCC 4.7035]WNC00668.1 endolytic transglycosylase MltG [Streptomyces sp. CGMCC 4.7035]